MTLAYACKVTGAPAKRIQNAFQVLNRGFGYPLQDVRRLGLAMMLVDLFTMDLITAWDFAGDALRQPDDVVRFGGKGKPHLEIDVPRYLSDFALRCAAAIKFPPRTAGRPRRQTRPRVTPRDFGIDLEAIEANAKRTPEERLRSLDEDWKFLQAIRS